jgi:hypothetical protein
MGVSETTLVVTTRKYKALVKLQNIPQTIV